MNKQEFLDQLRNGLNGLPAQEIEERITFYSEMIDDGMEEGLSEEEAVGGIGSVESIISQILSEIPLAKCIKEKITPKRRLGAVEIVLLVVGSPIWISLLIAFVSVILSVYISLWAVVISLWAIYGSLVACAISGIIAGIGYVMDGYGFTGFTLIGGGLTCSGISIFLFYLCKAATKGVVLILKNFLLWIKRKFINKEVL